MGVMKAAVLSLVVLVSTTCVAQNTVKTSYEDGTLKSEYVKKGHDLVAVTNYYKSGAVKETGFFKNEIPDGQWVTYSENGAKTAELSYVDGKRHGEFRVWDEYSNAYMEIHYAKGKIITANRYVKETDFAAKDH
jgi:antitoxin component YwqK of YwqJK toxin-antitoxin module